MPSSAPGDEVTLDDVVARVRELPTRFRSLYVETDGWTDWVLSQRASACREGLLAPPPQLPPDTPRERTEHHVRMWMEFDPERWDHPLVGVTPRRCRVEDDYTHFDGSVTTTISGTDGTAWWSERDGEAERRDPSGGVRSLQSFWVVSRQWLADRVGRALVDADVEVLGRRCARVRVTPPSGVWAPGPFHAGDEHLLAVDTETGLTLAVTGLHDGEAFSHHEVLALELDAEIEPELTAPPDGAVPARAPRNHQDEREVASDADGLVLLAPTWLPDGYTFGTGGAGARDDGEMHAALYYRCEGRPTAMVSQFPSESLPDREVDGWTSVVRGDRRVVVSDMTDAEGTRLAWTQVDGTRAMVRAELSADEILDLTFSLEPVGFTEA